MIVWLVKPLRDRLRRAADAWMRVEDGCRAELREFPPGSYGFERRRLLAEFSAFRSLLLNSAAHLVEGRWWTR